MPITKKKKKAKKKKAGSVDFQGKTVTIGEKKALEDLKRLNKKNEIEFETENGHVTELEIWGKESTTLPESIGNLESLKNLDLEHNELTTLPESIGKLKRLTYLYLYDNQLETLPDSFSNLTMLKELDLRGNEFLPIPESFGHLTNLRTLLIGEDQADHFPRKLANQLKAQGCRVHYEAREWIGGPGGDWERVRRDYFTKKVIKEEEG